VKVIDSRQSVEYIQKQLEYIFSSD
jgi:hypothetical protein